MRTRERLPWVVALILVAGCGRKKDWDTEIIVQVFKPQGTDVGTVTVSATQAGKTNKTTVDGFGDCDANRVRLIPKQGSSEELTVSVSSSGSLQVTCPTGASSCGADCCKLTPPGVSPLKLVLGTSKDLEPSGSCTPSVQPPTPDGGTPKKAAGEACTADTDCEGGSCLKELQNTGNPLAFPGGYCSQSCPNGDECPTDQTCVQSTDGNGTVIGTYCLVNCVTGDGKCTRTGYTCNPAGGTCVPE